MSTKANTQKSDKSVSVGFSEGEKAAIRARAQELKAEARASKDRAEGERAVLAAIAKMPAPYRAMGERIHKIITSSAPNLIPKTWYGLPAYANDNKIVCYMRMNPKPPYNDRYMNFGFNEAAKLDEGNIWSTTFALVKLTSAEEAMIAELVKKAVS
jgi:uncharacterized protein YdhG (YjbR/CyaY superfamily)